MYGTAIFKSISKSTALLAALSLPLGTVPTPSRADTPAAGIAVGLAVSFVAGLASAAAYDALTSDTTTTETTTTTEPDGTTTTTTTTTSSQMQSPPPDDSDLDIFGRLGDATPFPIPGKDLPFPPRDWPKLPKLPKPDNMIGAFIPAAIDDASVHAAGQKFQKVAFKVERVMTVRLTRGQKFDEHAKPMVMLAVGQMFASTRDIPKTQGNASVSLVLSINGKDVYKAGTRVRQGQQGQITASREVPKLAVNKSDMIAASAFVEGFELGKPSDGKTDVLQLRIVTEGTGAKI